jgi:hypothetical protein
MFSWRQLRKRCSRKSVRAAESQIKTATVVEQDYAVGVQHVVAHQSIAKQASHAVGNTVYIDCIGG